MPSLPSIRFPCVGRDDKTLTASSLSGGIGPVCCRPDEFVVSHGTAVLVPQQRAAVGSAITFARWGAAEKQRVDTLRPPRPEHRPNQPWDETRRTLWSLP